MRLRRSIASALVVCALATGSVVAKSRDVIKLFSPEITYTEDNNVVKFRPVVHISPDSRRTDFMFGRKLEDMTVYGYYKTDNKDRNWMGVRVDRSVGLGEKLNANLQLRYFVGLDSGSANHFYVIPSISYKLDDMFNVGVMGYAKKSEGKDPFFYIGPSLGVKLTDKVSVSVSYCRDVLGRSDDLLYCGFKFKFK